MSTEISFSKKKTVNHFQGTTDIEFEKRMKEIFGAEWQDFLFMYQQQMKTPPQIPSDYGTIE